MIDILFNAMIETLLFVLRLKKEIAVVTGDRCLLMG